MKEKIYETIIIGAGIAGLTSAIYASRKRMNYLIIATKFGGQLTESSEVLNYPGIKKTTGVEFSKKLKEQADFNEINVLEETVEKIQQKEENYIVKTNENTYLTKTIIIASGSHPRKLDIKGEKEYFHKGLTYCAICDGPLFADKNVAIIGGGNAALEAVDFVKEICPKIYLIVLNDKLDGHEYLQEKVINNPKVEIIYNAETKEIIGDKFVSGIKYFDKKEQIKKTLDVQGIIIEAGRVPNTNFVKDLLKIDEHQHIIIDCQTNTSKKGIFAAGDCTSGHEYQYIIAAGQGCMALLKASKYLGRN